MKNLVIVLLLTLASCAQKPETDSRINIVNVSALSFFKQATGNSIPLSATEGNITLAFGRPEKVSRDTTDSKSYPFTKWIYNGATIYIQAGRMVNIDLKTPSFGFAFKGDAVKVGENISKLKQVFPESFLLKTSSQLMVGLHYNGELIDSHILFDFNKAGKITAICLMN